MVSLECFNTQLIGIMNDFTKAVIIQIKSSAAVQINVKENLNELGERLDDLWVEAIDKILRIVELVTTTKQHDPPSIQSEEKDDKILRIVELVTTTKQHDPLSIQSEETKDLHTDTNGINEPCGSVEKDPDSGDDDVDEGGMSPSQSLPTLTRDHDHQYALASANRRKKALILDAERRKKALILDPERRKKALILDPEHRKKALVLDPEPMTHSCKWSWCTSLFPNEYRLELHYQKVHTECKTCGEHFPGIKKLREHKIKVHRIMPYKCDYCDKGFSHKGHCDVHVKRQHTGEKSCHCDICGKAYACADSLKIHRVVHFDKSFMCDVCGKRFYHAGHLERHKHIHKEVRPYQCPTCGKSFTQVENMKRHQAAFHSDQLKKKESHLCSICGKIYTTREGLKYHMASIHSEVSNSKECLITCDVCGKKFQFPCQYKLHKVTHERGKAFFCHICGKSYKRKETLAVHMDNHTGKSKSYKCSVCGKTFSLRANFTRHKSIHSGEMPYSCKECGKRFRLLIFLKAHEQTLGHKRRTSCDMVSTENTNSSRYPTAGNKKKSSKVFKNSSSTSNTF